ncbi:MAG TPA: hypothetical protein VGV36_07610 [Solirubrobacteraceae bacterium]|nr:hypothetical protein [Solirubrobacteraceae bacterium]
MATSARIDQPQPPLGLLLDVDVDGALVRLRARYDAGLIARLKALPGRRYVPEETVWVLPARRAALVALAELLLEVGDQAALSDRARRRLWRHGPGHLHLRDGEFEIRAAPRPRRLQRIRALPERRFIAEQGCWRVPLTRAGALALQALVDDGELVATPAAATRLQQTKAGSPATTGEHVSPRVGAQRASPVAHWRHVTRGPIYAADPTRREWIEGIGWCVRVRVDPGQRPATEPKRTRR